MVDFKADERLNTLNHSCAHVMAQAVKHLYPNAKFWVGPVVKEGFYYDIDLGDTAVNDDVIAAIEKEMKKVCKEGKKIYRREISKAEALELFKDDEYKLDLIDGLEDGNISVYDQGDFTDLCRGPHVDNTKLCKNFKLIKYSGVYWKGDANNHVMQRIYGVCFPTAEELEEHLKLLEEAKDRDHRKIGKEMHLFMSDDLVGRGLPRAGKGSGRRVPLPYRAAADRRAGRGQDAGRSGHLRTALLLRVLHGRVRPRVHQDGQNPEPESEPHQDLRHLRTADVLPETRAGRLRGCH